MIPARHLTAFFGDVKTFAFIPSTCSLLVQAADDLLSKQNSLLMQLLLSTGLAGEHITTISSVCHQDNQPAAH